MKRALSFDDVTGNVEVLKRSRRRKSKLTNDGSAASQPHPGTKVSTSNNNRSGPQQLEAATNTDNLTSEVVLLTPGPSHNESVQQLKMEVDTLRSTVQSLTLQVNFLLSFVGVNDDVSSNNAELNFNVTNTEVSGNKDVIVSTAGSTSIGESVNSVEVTAVKSSHTYSDILRQSCARSGTLVHRKTNIREMAVAAVYKDRAEAQRRAASFIINGIQKSDSSTDRDQITKLCTTEFGVCPEIAHYKRLGKPLPGKIQPLLVYLKRVDQANFIVSSARQLRDSEDTYTRQSIYINENLTKAAARAAFELRCERRSATGRHVLRRQNGSNGSDITPPLASEVELHASSHPSTLISVPAQGHQQPIDIGSVLNADAANFCPKNSTSTVNSRDNSSVISTVTTTA